MEDNQLEVQSEETYKIIRNTLLTAKAKVYTAVNLAMVQAYWKIGEEIQGIYGDNEMAEYGTNLSCFSNWSHYTLLIRVKNEDARKFYMIECVKANWSVRQLERQINTFYYERLLASRDKESISKESTLVEKMNLKIF